MRGLTLLPLLAVLACTSGGEDTGPSGPEDNDQDGFYGQSDCNDDDPSVYPGADDACDDEVDNDCDGEVDEGKTTYYEDRDEDGYGDPDKTVQACTKPGKAYSKVADDCDDLNALVNAEQSERCSTVDVDDDCDGEVDEASAIDTTTFFFDYDGDGYGGSQFEVDVCGSTPPANHSDTADDCDDTDPAVSPAAEEVCDDGLDNDCDASSDADCDFAGKIHFFTADARIYGANPGDGAGSGVASGDVNGDGIPDLLISAKSANLSKDEDPPLESGGAVYVIHGPVNGPIGLEHADATVTGVVAGDVAGTALASGGDVNGDGYDDILVGAPGASPDNRNYGGVTYLLAGPVTDGSLANAHAMFAGEVADDQSGRYVAMVGDVDADGLDDMMVGSLDSNSFGNDSGAAYLILGPVTGTIELADAEAEIQGEATFDRLGSVAGATSTATVRSTCWRAHRSRTVSARPAPARPTCSTVPSRASSRPAPRMWCTPASSARRTTTSATRPGTRSRVPGTSTGTVGATSPWGPRVRTRAGSEQGPCTWSRA